MHTYYNKSTFQNDQMYGNNSHLYAHHRNTLIFIKMNILIKSTSQRKPENVAKNTIKCSSDRCHNLSQVCCNFHFKILKLYGNDLNQSRLLRLIV